MLIWMCENKLKLLRVGPPSTIGACKEIATEIRTYTGFDPNNTKVAFPELVMHLCKECAASYDDACSEAYAEGYVS